VTPPVKKLGSQWHGEVTAVSDSGEITTNINAAEVEAFTSAKIRIHIGTTIVRRFSSDQAGHLTITAKDGAIKPGVAVMLEFLA